MSFTAWHFSGLSPNKIGGVYARSGSGRVLGAGVAAVLGRNFGADRAGRAGRSWSTRCADSVKRITQNQWVSRGARGVVAWPAVAWPAYVLGISSKIAVRRLIATLTTARHGQGRGWGADRRRAGPAGGFAPQAPAARVYLPRRVRAARDLGKASPRAVPGLSILIDQQRLGNAETSRLQMGSGVRESSAREASFTRKTANLRCSQWGKGASGAFLTPGGTETARLWLGRVHVKLAA